MRQASKKPAICAGPDPASADPYARYRFVGNVFALVIVAASAFELIANARHPIARDFVSFWGAARLVLAGHPAAAYDNAALHAVQAAVVDFGAAGAEMPFPYPPAYLGLVTPFGLLPFPLAMAVWTLCTLAFYLVAARTLFPRAGWLPVAFPAVFANSAIGQNGFLTSGIFMIGLSLMRRRPFVAGTVLGCMVLKPQLALLLPVAFAAAQAWRVIAGAAISSIGIMLVGFVLFGPETTSGWLHELPLYARIGRDGLVGWPELASVYASARQLGLGFGAAIAIHAIVAVFAAAAVWHIWRSPGADETKIAALAAASMLASPYLFFYDGLMLVPAFFWLARQARTAGWFLAIWCLPLVGIAQVAGFAAFINLNAVTAILLLALVYRGRNFDGPRCGAAESPPVLRVEQPSAVTLS